MKNALLLLSLFIISSYSMACSCGSLPNLTKKGVLESSEIFEGKIIKVEIDSISRTKTATFLVTKHLKSKSKKDTIKINTSRSGASCGLYFQTGQTWYIFPYEHDGVLRAGLCGRSMLLKKREFNHKIWSKYYWLNKKYHRKKIKRYRRDKRVIRRTK